MASTDQRYQVSSKFPVIYQRGRAQQAALTVTRAGLEITPSAATYALLAPGGSAIVTASAAVPGTPTTFALTATHLAATRALGTGYHEEWDLTLPDGTQRLVRRAVSLAKFQLTGPVTQADLLGEYPDLLDNVASSYVTSLQGWIDAAWGYIYRHLESHGDFPYIIVDTSQLYDVQLEMVLERYFRALYNSAQGSERYRELWMSHEQKAKAARTSLRITVDRDQDGQPDSTGRKPVGHRSIHLNAPYTTDPRHLSKKFR